MCENQCVEVNVGCVIVLVFLWYGTEKGHTVNVKPYGLK